MRIACAAALGILCAGAVRAQLVSSPIEPWSPIARRADIPRTLPSTNSVPWALWSAPLPAGLFATTGNPAALAWELADIRSDYAVGQTRESGEYHRPFDPGAYDLWHFDAAARTNAVPHTGLLGDVLEEEESLSSGPRADQGEPYGSSPLVIADSAASPMLSSRAMLRGAGGWTIGSWALGVSAAYDTRDLHTDRAAFARRMRIAEPGAVVGVLRRIGGPFRIAAGAHAGTAQRSETASLAALDGWGLIHQVAGYRAAPPVVVNATYYQRLERRTQFAGADIAATVAGASLSLGAELSDRRDATTHAATGGAPADRWNASGAAYHLMIERDAGVVGTMRLTVHSSTASGSLRLPADSAPSFRAHERSTYTALELRTIASSRLRTLASLIVVDEERRRGDSVSTAAIGLHDRYPTLVLSAEYALSDRAAMLVGLSGAWYRSAGEVPSHTGIAAYEQLISPEIALAASSMQTHASEIGLRWRLAPGTFASVLARRETLAAEGFRQFDELPPGQRTATQMMLRLSVVP